MVLRPFGLVINGELQIGLEIVIDDGVITKVRPHTGMPDDYVISPAFVNAHSHLEYRGLQGKVEAGDYFRFIRGISELKKFQSYIDVKQDCAAAALENRATGVALIGEHSDRPFSGAALARAGIGGIIFQELITFFEQRSPAEKLREVEDRRAAQAWEFAGETALAPHTPYTVDPATLVHFAHGAPFSIHAAESIYENSFFRSGEGPIADFYRRFDFNVTPTGKSAIATLAELGLVRAGAQFVHCCDVSREDIDLLAQGEVRVAHCPRSNENLNCPIAPIREMLDAGIRVGLGLDSAASSGAIDMFAEMRCALDVSINRGKPLLDEEVWSMASSVHSLPMLKPPTWGIFEGSSTPLIEIHVSQPASTADLIERGSPSLVKWVTK